MKYTIYQIKNKINGKIYIGKHQTENIDDEYFGSGVALREAIKKYGKETFVKEILFVFESEDEMNAKERGLVTEEFVSRKDTYNLGVGGEGGPHFKGKTHSDETIEKIKKNSGSVRSGAIRHERYKNGELVQWNKGKTGVFTEDRNKKISDYRTGKKHKPETIEKIKAARARQEISDETRHKMSETRRKKSSNR